MNRHLLAALVCVCFCVGCASTTSIDRKRSSAIIAAADQATDPLQSFLLYDSFLVSVLPSTEEQLAHAKRRRDELLGAAMAGITNEMSHPPVWHVSDVIFTSLGSSFKDGDIVINPKTGTLIRVQAILLNVSTSDASSLDIAKFSAIEQSQLRLMDGLSPVRRSGQWIDDSDLYLVTRDTIHRCIHICSSSHFPIREPPIQMFLTLNNTTTKPFIPKLIPRETEAVLDMVFLVQGPATNAQLVIKRGHPSFVPLVEFADVPTNSNPASSSSPKTPAPKGMTWIPGGVSVMGQSGVALPVRKVIVSDYWMSENEISKALWDEVYSWAITNGYKFDHAGKGLAPEHPAHDVSWYDCVKWCNARSEKEGMVPAYYTSTDLSPSNVFRKGVIGSHKAWVRWTDGYRLPTEREWEHAARGGAQNRLFPWGDTIRHEDANYCSNTNEFSYDHSATQFYHPSYYDSTNGLARIGPMTSPVGRFPPNAFGLYDITGNLSEWCWNYFSDAQPDAPRAVRGCSWSDNAANCRLATRRSAEPRSAHYTIGFRVVLPPESPASTPGR